MSIKAVDRNVNSVLALFAVFLSTRVYSSSSLPIYSFHLLVSCLLLNGFFLKTKQTTVFCFLRLIILSIFLIVTIYTFSMEVKSKQQSTTWHIYLVLSTAATASVLSPFEKA